MIKVLSPTNVRCTQATLEAFGIFGICPTHGAGVYQSLQRAKRAGRILSGADLRAKGRKTITVAEFVKAHPTGSYYISTTGHAMALVEGVLTDTSGRGPDRRHIQVVIEVL